MLLGSFYTLVESNQEEGGYRVKVRLNPSHAIFDGHFPGNPVVPGVCQIQMAQEVLNQVTGKNLQLKTTGNIKFLHTINPVTDEVVEMELLTTPMADNKIELQASYNWNEKTCFKFKGYFE